MLDRWNKQQGDKQKNNRNREDYGREDRYNYDERPIGDNSRGYGKNKS